jgi:hypothetical protein
MLRSLTNLLTRSSLLTAFLLAWLITGAAPIVPSYKLGEFRGRLPLFWSYGDFAADEIALHLRLSVLCGLILWLAIERSRMRQATKSQGVLRLKQDMPNKALQQNRDDVLRS